MEAGSVEIRLSSERVGLPWEEAQALLQRLDQARATGAAEAIRNRPRAGAVLTHHQKADVWNVIDAWLVEVGSDRLGQVLRLREALEVDLDIGTGDPAPDA